MKKKTSPRMFLLVGWLGGVAAVLLLGLGWPAVFPSGLNLAEFYGTPLGPPLVILVSMLIASPAAMVGGLLGSRVPLEGGRSEQYIVSAVTGALLALPFACLTMWKLTP